MRILILGPARAGDFAWYVERALRALGHDTRLCDLVHSDTEDPLWSRAQWKIAGLKRLAVRRMNQRALALWRRQRPDLVIVCKGRFLLPQTVRRIRGGGSAIVNWYSDGIGEMEREFLIECLPHYTAFFTKDRYLAQRLRATGANAQYLPLACDPEIHRTWELSTQEQQVYGSDVGLVGSGYPLRLNYLAYLNAQPLKLWGSAWRGRLGPRAPGCWQGRAVRGIEQAKVFNATKINVNTVHFFEVDGVNRRTFDIAGCGGFQICTAAPSDLARLFEVGREVVVGQDARGLQQIIRYYLAHEEERRAIGQQAQRRAHRDHTYRRRIEALLDAARLG